MTSLLRNNRNDTGSLILDPGCKSRSGVPLLSLPHMLGNRTNALVDALNEVLAA